MTPSVPYCKGGVMAKNPQWRGSLATWRARVAGWIRHSKPEDLLSVDIFFDLRWVHGDAKLVAALHRDASGMAAGEVAFARPPACISRGSAGSDASVPNAAGLT
jgi:CBS domain-containing protein